MIKRYKIDNFDDVTKGNIKENWPVLPQVPNHPYRILIIGGSVYENCHYLIY